MESVSLKCVPVVTSVVHAAQGGDPQLARGCTDGSWPFTVTLPRGRKSGATA